MRIAIIGSGVSGLVAAYRLSPRHEVTLYEALDYLGGHAHTVDVAVAHGRVAIDTGFIVFNNWNYPEFTRLLEELDVATQTTSMSFSCQSLTALGTVECEYNGNNLNGLFAQRRNLMSWRFHKMLLEILRFNRLVKQRLCLLRDAPPRDQTLGEFLQAEQFSEDFTRRYLLPMGAAIWSCPLESFQQFPLHFVGEFFYNHGLLNVWNRPQWSVVQNGSRTYIEKLNRKLQCRLLLSTPVAAVVRYSGEAIVTTQGGDSEVYDHVIFACHSDQALKILRDPTPLERSLLAAIPYQRNTAILHTDQRLMPSSRRAWASWNVRLSAGDEPHTCVTYWMNRLQNLRCPEQFFVSLNAEELIDPRTIQGRYEYEHPVFSSTGMRAQQRHHELINVNRTSFIGAYWRNGFHEDGVVSANRVAAVLSQEPAFVT